MKKPLRGAVFCLCGDNIEKYGLDAPIHALEIIHTYQWFYDNTLPWGFADGKYPANDKNAE
ncbi:MAG: hypothetical protein E7598_00140 [Ruminococcaceae bacterium]|nr:hypothetical protein [Oscillospiraceae bacterium]